MDDFKPPLEDPLARLGVEIFLILSRRWLEYELIHVDDADLQKLRALKGKRVVLCANHCQPHDPAMIYLLQKKLGERFNFVAAREIFERWHGLMGWLIQGVGTYSVERHRVDRRSVSTSIKLIVAGSKLVIFPECELSYRHDRLLPIDSRLSGLFLRSAAVVQKRVSDEPVYVLPLGLKYRYLSCIAASLNNALVRIELTLKLDHHGSLVRRFQRARSIVLSNGFSAAANPAAINALTSFDVVDSWTQEVLASGIDLLERQLYGRCSEKGRRQATVKVGDPIDVTQLWKRHGFDRQAELLLTEQIEEQLCSLLSIRRTTRTSPLPVTQFRRAAGL